MKVLGLEIARSRELTAKAAVPALTPSMFAPTSSTRGGWQTIWEPFAGAWQRNVSLQRKDVTANSAVFACMTLIASDVSKLGRPKFKRLSSDGIWEESESAAYDPVLREPNQFQTPNQFWESWILSKLWKGNTYALKGRDERNVVRRLWILDPCMVTPLISTAGDVFYQIDQDNLSGVKAAIVVPQSEIIHDRMNTIFSPLCGIPPLYAAGLAASLGLNIMENAAAFFANKSLPGGILTTPNTIPPETAERIKREWNTRYKTEGATPGETAVLGDGLTFEPMMMKATDAQLLELGKATAEWVCSVFHVPLYKIGAAPTPALANVQALNLEYYGEAIQKQLEDIEACLERGLEMKAGTTVEFCTEGLLRMDTVSRIASLKDAVGASIMSPNEARAQLDLPPVTGGESPLSQQQYYSLEALGKRDMKDDPFASAAPKAPPQPAEPQDSTGDNSNDNSGEADQQRHLEILSRAFRAAA